MSLRDFIKGMVRAGKAVDEVDGLTHLQALMGESEALVGIGRTLGMHLAHAEKGFVVFESTPDEKYYNLIGSAHGGYIATLLDSACGGATHSMLAPGQTYTTIELKVSYHKMVTVQTGTVRAEGRILSMGRRVAFAEAKLVDKNGKLLASATSTLLITNLVK
jgi:uncharacterized protein (TIGR00369 family)